MDGIIELTGTLSRRTPTEISQRYLRLRILNSLLFSFFDTFVDWGLHFLDRCGCFKSGISDPILNCFNWLRDSLLLPKHELRWWMLLFPLDLDYSRRDWNVGWICSSSWQIASISLSYCSVSSFPPRVHPTVTALERRRRRSSTIALSMIKQLVRTRSARLIIFF